MFKIDLEKEILKPDSKKEKELLEEAKDILAKTTNNERIKSIFQGSVSKVSEIIADERIGKIFGDKLITITKIEKMAVDYHLRFLPIVNSNGRNIYTGGIGPNTETKILVFEEKLQTELDKEPDSSKYYILAPKESFDLQTKPKDPLLFYNLDSVHFVLVDKWGDDFSFTRRIKGWFLNHGLFGFLAMLLVFSLYMLFVMQTKTPGSVVMFVVFVVASIVSLILRYIVTDDVYGGVYDGNFLNLNKKWRSKYK